MLTKKQLRILHLCSRNVFKEYTFKEIKALSREKSTSVIQNAIAAFLREEVFTERKLGASKLYVLNHKNAQVYAYLEIAAREPLSSEAKKALQIVQEEAEKHTYFYALVIFGSYAAGQQKKHSDIDIAIIIEKEDERKKMEAALHAAKNKSLLGIDGHVFTQGEFLEMLTVEYENVGKQIARKHSAVHNSAIFYALVKDGIKHGFRV